MPVWHRASMEPVLAVGCRGQTQAERLLLSRPRVLVSFTSWVPKSCCGNTLEAATWPVPHLGSLRLVALSLVTGRPWPEVHVS